MAWSQNPLKLLRVDGILLTQLNFKARLLDDLFIEILILFITHILHLTKNPGVEGSS